MKRIIPFVASILVGLAIGAGTAIYAVNFISGSKDAIVNGPWSANLSAGQSSADMYTRAYIAVTAVLALSKIETIYYFAGKDSDGNALEGNCVYRIEGKDPDARWWSLTAYGSDHYLINNPEHRYSISKNTVQRRTDGSFTIRVSTQRTELNWIAGDPKGFDLLLRLYHPGSFLRNNPSTAPLPSIVKEACL